MMDLIVIISSIADVLPLTGMLLTGMMMGFDFAQPTLGYIKGFGDYLMLIERF